MGYLIEVTEEYKAWREEQTQKQRKQIAKRLANIENHEHFGHVRQLSPKLAELKFNNGVRIYYTIRVDQNKVVILLLGGNKNGQDKDIQKAKALLGE